MEILLAPPHARRRSAAAGAIAAAGLAAVARAAPHRLAERPDAFERLQPRGRTALTAWIAAGGSLGLLLPGVAAVRWRADPIARDVLGAYCGLTAGQVAFERAVRGTFPAMAPLTGLAATTLRLLQLAGALRAVDEHGGPAVRPPGVRSLLRVCAAFWAANLAFVARDLTARPPVGTAAARGARRAGAGASSG